MRRTGVGKKAIGAAKSPARERGGGRDGRRERSPRTTQASESLSEGTRIRFTTSLLKPKKGDRAGADVWGFVRLPREASARLPSRSMVSVEGTFNGRPIAVTLEPDGAGGHWLRIDERVCAAAGVGHGESVEMEVAPVEVEPEPVVPRDVKEALRGASPEARRVWGEITAIARRDWIQWITSGKRAETRAVRLEKACDMLGEGKRRPCCFDRSGMYGKGMSCPVAEGEADNGK